MAAKTHIPGQKFWNVLGQKLGTGLKIPHAKYGACFHSVTDPTVSDCTIIQSKFVVCDKCSALPI